MGFGALRNTLRPFVRTLLPHSSIRASPLIPPRFTSQTPELHWGGFTSIREQLQSWGFRSSNGIHSLTDTRFPKRRPGFENRRKRATLRPTGPIRWVLYTPGQPILPNNPNEGSVKNRNERKRARQRRAFIRFEAKKRKVLVQEAKRKKLVKRVERKMAAVARERAWTERLAELQRLEAEKAVKA